MTFGKDHLEFVKFFRIPDKLKFLSKSIGSFKMQLNFVINKVYSRGSSTFEPNVQI